MKAKEAMRKRGGRGGTEGEESTRTACDPVLRLLLLSPFSETPPTHPLVSDLFPGVFTSKPTWGPPVLAAFSLVTLGLGSHTPANALLCASGGVRRNPGIDVGRKWNTTTGRNIDMKIEDQIAPA